MEEYLKNIALKFARNESMVAKGREMIYRTDFENLMTKIFEIDGSVKAINHDSTNDGGNKPDFVISKNKVPVLYIEAKDIGVDLNKIEKSDQINRYFGYDNLVLTDYLEFRFFRRGEPYGEAITIATYDLKTRTIQPLPQNFGLLSKTLLDFASSHKEPIKKGLHLAKIMGGKALRIRDNVFDMIENKKGQYESLTSIENVIRDSLITNLDNEKFADMYAQTLVYGLFAARYNDVTAENFSRAEARDLISKTNPFLRDFFDHIAGANFPDRLRFIVDELCDVFTYADVQKLLHDFYGKEKDKDPVIHFYEDFLKEYDSKKKMEMGVFYTPQPIVKFIIKSVDQILKEEFGLTEGLADTSKIIKQVEQIGDKAKLVKLPKEFHKVQILDIATGTGTFLNEVINFVYESFKNGQEGRWQNYVQTDLLPRLHGFELMVASYTIAHLKLGMTLQDTGAGDINKRIGVYLTNTLNEPQDYTNQLPLPGIVGAVAEESKAASRIKVEYPVMCVIGNPPYSGESMNPHYKGHEVYKVEIGGKKKLQERNSKWINDDYVKFIRFAESLIEKNASGVIAMITAHGYIDNPTFRGMRWHLRKTFDKIYILDLHGNTNKKEISPDGSKDENVFDIKTGVSIIFGIKLSNDNKKKKLAEVYLTDFYGDRKSKLEKLNTLGFENINWQLLVDHSDIWKEEGVDKENYNKGFSINDLFRISSVGIVTSRDGFVIDISKPDLITRISNFLTRDNLEIIKNYGLKDSAKFKINKVLKHNFDESNVFKISYRPFDNRYVYYQNDFIERPRGEVMKNFIHHENIGLVTARSQKNPQWNALYISKYVTETKLGESSTQSAVFPLYIYEVGQKIPNLDKTIWQKINKIAGETTPENILDYIYAYLHSPSYREKYKEFLKADFPRVPLPSTKEQFSNLVKFGNKLRELHLMSSQELGDLITTYSISGSDIVEKITYKEEKVYINSEQYFGNVPEVAWNFFIGGYQPAQKWIKDRKDKKLSNEDILYYQKIIKALVETNNIMQQIDNII